MSSKSTRGRVGRLVVMVMEEGGAGDELMFEGNLEMMSCLLLLFYRRRERNGL